MAVRVLARAPCASKHTKKSPRRREGKKGEAGCKPNPPHPRSVGDGAGSFGKARALGRRGFAAVRPLARGPREDGERPARGTRKGPRAGPVIKIGRIGGCRVA